MAKSVPSVTLTGEEIGKLTVAETILDKLNGELDKAERCGIGCQEWRQMASDARTKLAALRKEYAGPIGD